MLGIIYEYNREPGDVTRATLHPILSTRVGPDVFANRILRLREDVRFKNVGPEVLEMSEEEDFDGEDGLWFDWPFVEFLKNNYRKLMPFVSDELCLPAVLISQSQCSDQYYLIRVLPT